MERKLNIKVGQEIVATIIKGSNASRGLMMTLDNIDSWCFTGEVVKAGKKYITVKFNDSIEQFSVEDDYQQRYTHGGADYKLYMSKDEVVEEFETNRIYDELKDKLNGKELTLDQLRQIKEIIG